jgi:hypothetical protein
MAKVGDWPLVEKHYPTGSGELAGFSYPSTPAFAPKATASDRYAARRDGPTAEVASRRGGEAARQLARLHSCAAGGPQRRECVAPRGIAAGSAKSLVHCKAS